VSTTVFNSNYHSGTVIRLKGCWLLDLGWTYCSSVYTYSTWQKAMLAILLRYRIPLHGEQCLICDSS